MALQNDQNFRHNMMNALRDAAREGRVDDVADTLGRQKWLLGSPGALYDAMDDAVRKGHNAVLQVFFDKGVDVDLQNDFGNTLLQAAAAQGQVGTMIYLLDRGADINHQDKKGNTALYYAALSAAPGAAEKLVDMGADAGLRGNGGLTPLQAARKQLNIKFADRLATYIARRNERRVKQTFARRHRQVAP